MQPAPSTTFGSGRTRHCPASRPVLDAPNDVEHIRPCRCHVPRMHLSDRRSVACQALSSQRNALFSSLAPPQQRRPPSSLHALPADSLADAAQQLASLDHSAIASGAHSAVADLAQHLSLAYERVTLPCSSMNCGDAIYRRFVRNSHRWYPWCRWFLCAVVCGKRLTGVSHSSWLSAALHGMKPSRLLRC